MTVLVFTGTMAGTTELQHFSLGTTLSGYDIASTEVCHGLAVGADYQCHQLCRNYGFLLLQGFPGNIPGKRADIPDSDFAILRAPKYPLDRNRDMVDYATLYSKQDSLLIACPGEDYEIVRSGTWATVRYARSCGMDILYIWPSDGKTELRKPGDPHYRSRTRQV